MSKSVLGLMMWLLFFWAGPCFGWGDTWDSIRTAASKIESIQSDFRQEKHMRMLVGPLISKGRLTYQAPDSLRWEYRDPIKNILLMDAGKTQRFVQSDGAWIKDASADIQGMQVVMEQITQWFAGRFDDHPLFAATLHLASGESGPRIILKPKEAAVAEMIERVELLLSSKPGIMEAVIIYEDNDSFTKLMFINPVVNDPIAPAIFQKHP